MYFQREYIPTIPSWDLGATFHPLEALAGKRQGERWVNFNSEACNPPCQDLQSAPEYIALTNADCNLEDLRFRDDKAFVSNNLCNYSDEWDSICHVNGDGKKVCEWIRHGIDVHAFLHHFRGHFKGKGYDCSTPPSAYFANSGQCESWVDFISQTLEERIKNGSVRVLGRVGEVPPPHIVMPLTVEPTKPRLCHDERFLNLWVKDCPVKLDTLREVPRVVCKDDYLTNMDDKSGYDHVGLSEGSQKYFGMEWAGWFFTYATLPLGFKASSYIYQTIGMLPTSYLRQLSVPVLQYIDDRLVPQCTQTGQPSRTPYGNAKRAIFIVCTVLLRLGYFLSLSKSVFIPVQILRWLGMTVNSKLQAFLLPEDKRRSFAVLRESILAKDVVSALMLQRFAGKCISFLLAVPGAGLYTREVNRAISMASRRSKPVGMYPELITELQYWRFLDDWQESLPWRDERHLQLILATDASLYKWGSVVYFGSGECFEMGDFWHATDQRPIHLKEAAGLLAALRSVSGEIRNHRVDAFVDNMALLSSWVGEGSRDRELTDIVKEILQFTLQHNVSLKLCYVPSERNPADLPSRTCSKDHTTLSTQAWVTVEELFGPHTIDLMALDSNTMRARSGYPLGHFTPFPMPDSSGVNVFSQTISPGENAYVFPPFHLISALLAFLSKTPGLECTMILPDLTPTPSWWPYCMSRLVRLTLLGRGGDKSVVLIPSKSGFIPDTKGLPWDLLIARLKF